jgi:hypothetical protein
LPGIDLDGFVSDAHRVAPDAAVITPGYDEVLAIPPNDAKSAALAD